MDEVALNEGSLHELRRQVEELRASRARLLAAADAQRRKIERALHDGTQQHLVALAVKLQLARQLDDSERSALKALLEEIANDLGQALEEVRRLGWRIYPTLLLERGLAEALRAAGSEAAIPTRVEASALQRCTAEVEAMVYFCCVELLERAAEAGERATVRVGGDHGVLRFDVIIDGAAAGWETQALSGVSDRFAALGGHLTISSRRGDAVFITGTIPLDADLQAWWGVSFSASAR